ncbi:DUF4365 domain-containing protein [uncultured Sulfuricurvum sp.]|uniref:DUF4365 domain-containing protein n=1 Tax=uncultured Sulfuricurvum sp. TaxID=430693 RepID=UPI002628F739|nr:DUF4365 domain-containing protein [uncultured Sulfuricurvum sp.]
MPLSPRYPQRVNNHQLEELSERFFQSSLPRNWICDKPENDYGVDQRVELFQDNNAVGLELLVQLKSSQSGTEYEYETIRLKTTTYNYLWDKLQVVLLVKYVQSENKAYWLLLSDVPEPNQGQETFTIRIPKENDLESIDWQMIYNYVQTITNEKLEVRRRGRRNS